jgi:cell wall-associated NlpC family hydrolase
MAALVSAFAVTVAGAGSGPPPQPAAQATEPSPWQEPGDFDLGPRPQVVQLGGAGATRSKLVEAEDDAPSRAAETDPDERRVVRTAARSELESFHHHPKNSPDAPKSSPDPPKRSPGLPKSSPDLPKSNNIPKRSPNVRKRSPDPPKSRNLPKRAPDVPKRRPGPPKSNNLPKRSPNVPKRTPAHPPKRSPNVPKRTPAHPPKRSPNVRKRGRNAPTGARARVRPDGIAVAPDRAPKVVKQVIRAGNRIAKMPYKWGGGHGSWRDSGYDCSGSVSFALAGAGLLTRPRASGGFASWGAPGPGKWITVYASFGHVYMVVAGLRFDTSGRAGAGTRWQGWRSTVGYVVRHSPGL